MITKLSALVLSVVIGLPMIEPAFASDPMAGIWDSRLGDRFEIKDGKIRTRGAFGRYQGTKGLVMSPLSQQHATPMQCELELFDATTLKGICTGGRFINAYEFKAFKIGSGA